VLPPFLAGREPEQALVRGLLRKLADGTPSGTDVILYGPRGNGKTALLEWALREAEKRKIGVLDIGLGESEASEAEESNGREPSAMSRWLRALSGLSVLGAAIKWREMPMDRIPAVLERRARKGPLLATVDEAQTLTLPFGRALLSAAQRCQRRQLPVMLLLAGTPDLPRHLNAMEATFWDRGRQLPVDRLGPDASVDAIQVPIEERGRSIAPEAVQRVAEESQGYPYFLQMWGQALWDRCPCPSATIGGAEVESAKPTISRQQGLFYLNRYRELDDLELLPVAASVAAEYSSSERVLPGQVDRAIRTSLENDGRARDSKSVREASRRLQDLGYIWPVVRESIFYHEPGIPSLMQFVARNQKLRNQNFSS